MGVSKKQQACMECTKNCLKIHGKRPTSTVATPSNFSFFKIMIGDFQEVMFIPPKIAQNFRHLLNEETHLEDSDGRRWRVGISVIDGSLAFKHGWRDFLLDHSIQVGEFVVFKCTGGSFFSVQVFATSACERLNFSKRNNGNKRKRKRDETELTRNLSHLEENNESSQCSKEKLCAADEDPVKENRIIELVPCDLSGIELAAPIRNPPFDNSTRLPIAPPTNYSKGPRDMNNGDAVGDEEVGKISFIDLCDEDDMEIEKPTEDNFFPSVDGPRGHQIKRLVECCNDGKGNLVAGDGMINKYPLTKEHTSTIDHQNPESSAFKQEGIDIPPINFLDPGTTERVYSPQDSRTLLVNEENLSPQSNNLERPQTQPEVESSESETTNAVEDRIVELLSFDLPDFELTTRNCDAKGMEEDLAALGRNLPFDDSMRLPIAYPMNCSEGLYDANNTDAVGVEEAGKTSVINLCDDENMEMQLPTKDNSFPSVDSPGGLQIKCLEECCNDGKGNLVAGDVMISKYPLTKEPIPTVDHLKPESSAFERPPIDFMDPVTTERTYYPQDMNRLLMNVEYLSHPNNNLERPQTEPEVECSESDKTNQSEASWAIVIYPLTEKGLSTVDGSQEKNLADSSWMTDQGEQKFHGSNLSDKQMIDIDPDTEEIFATSFSRYTDASCNADERENLFVSSEVVCEFLISEEETCCNVDEDLMDKHEANRDAPISISHIERGDSACTSDEAVMTRNKSCTCEDSLEVPIINCPIDVKGNVMSSCELIKDNQAKEQSGHFPASGSDMVNASSVETAESNPLTMPDVAELPKDPERNSFLIGIMPENSPEVVEKKVDSCLQEKPFRIIKIESMESEDLPLPNSSVENAESDPLTIPDVYEFPKDPERNSFPTDNNLEFLTGILPEDSPEVDEKKVDTCFQEKPFGVVKIESMESEDISLPNHANFTISVCVNTQSWLNLHERLPSRIRQRKRDRAVVVLRDLNMRLWPVLYHESPKFVGFIGGWEEFVTANNLHEGDLYQFELTDEREPTFQMRKP